MQSRNTLRLLSSQWTWHMRTWWMLEIGNHSYTHLATPYFSDVLIMRITQRPKYEWHRWYYYWVSNHKCPTSFFALFHQSSCCPTSFFALFHISFHQSLVDPNSVFKIVYQVLLWKETMVAEQKHLVFLTCFFLSSLYKVGYFLNRNG